MLEFVFVASHPEYVAPKMLSFLKSHELTDKIQVAKSIPSMLMVKNSVRLTALTLIRS